jgi:tetratricopeptide (TPR) repeat protein
MDELGALRKAQGRQKEAMAIYREMADLSRDAKDNGAMAIALENEFELVPPEDCEQKRDVASKWVAVLEETIDQGGEEPSESSLLMYANALDSVAKMYKDQASQRKAEGDDAQADSLLKQAIETFEKSLALGDVGDTPVSSRLVLLAESHSLRGEHEKASELFGKIAEMPDSNRSWLAMKARQIEATMERNSDAYRQALEDLLKEFEGETRFAGQEREERYEVVLRKRLAVSYMRAGHHERSNELLAQVVGKGSDADSNAYVITLMAANCEALGQTEAHLELLKEVNAKYAGTGNAEVAARELQEIERSAKELDAAVKEAEERRRKLAERQRLAEEGPPEEELADRWRKRVPFLLANAVLIALIIVGFIGMRRFRK